MRHGVGTGERQGYASALAGVWSGLARTLAQLEAIAAEPAASFADLDAVEALPRLQYGLHTAGELVLGLEPPSGAESAHAELAAALADARDATAEVAEAAGAGGAAAVAPLVLEWRGALFRVRLARMRLTGVPAPGPAVRPTAPPPLPPPRAAAAATALVLLGVAGFAIGAMTALWPIWAAGLALVACSFAFHRASA